MLIKLGEKFKNIKEDTKKRIMATIMAGGIALSGLGMAGCNNLLNPDDPGTEITNPDNKYAKYSQILQNVLTDKYYTNISYIEDSDTDVGTKRWSYNNPKCLAIPYGFLEDEGFDIDKIKEKELDSKSWIYLIDNDLYVELLAEVKSNTTFTTGETSYYTNYLLKYNLTNQETKELKSLFKSLHSYRKTAYSQGPLFVQELSYLKKPEVLANTKITPNSLKAFEEECDEMQYAGYSHTLTYLNRIQTRPMAESGAVNYDHIFQTHKYDGNLNDPGATITTDYLYTLIFNITRFGYPDPVFQSTKQSAFIMTPENRQKIKESAVKITLLSANNCNFKNLLKERNIDLTLSYN